MLNWKPNLAPDWRQSAKEGPGRRLGLNASVTSSSGHCDF